MSVPFGSFSFSKGEIAPRLFGRVDQAAYHTAATTFRNGFVDFTGGFRSRAGTRFVGFSKQTGRNYPPRLVSFQFSILQGLALEFGNFYMRAISNGAYVTETPVPITGATNTNPATLSVTASTAATATPVNAGVTQYYAPGDTITLAGGTFVTPAVVQVVHTLLLSVSPGAFGVGYAPGDTIVPAGGTQIVPAQLTVLTTRAVSATVAAGGAGGTDGTQVVIGTTGTGTKFQATVTVLGGTITNVLSVTTGGSYTVNPTVLANEPVTGAALAGAQLDVVMGINTISVTGGGVFSVSPAFNQFTQTSTSGSGTGATFVAAVLAPQAVSFVTTGVYTALPLNPVSQAATSGVGIGAQFTIAWGAGSPFANGDWIAVTGVDGMTELNGNTYVLTGVTPTTVSLLDVYGNTVDATGFGAYLSGGIAAKIFTLVTPYTEFDLPWLKWTQSADVMSLCCRNQQSGAEYPPLDLRRITDSSWLLDQTTFGAGIVAPFDASAQPTNFPTASTTPPILPTAYAYVVTAVSNAGEESVASPIGNITNGVDISVTSGSNVVTWQSSPGAKYYNVYKAPTNFNTNPGNPNFALPVPAGSQFSYVGFSYGNQFVDSNITADGAQVPPLHTNPFARGSIIEVVVTIPGSGLTTVTPTITTSTGTGAVLLPVIANGAMLTVIVANGGEGYLPTDTVSFGGPGAYATGEIVFTLNPSNGDTITLGGTTWTFVTVSPGANETQIQGSLSATLTQLVADLSLSSDGAITAVQHQATATDLVITYGAPGPTGNLYTLAASAATPSGPALSGGGAGSNPQGFLVLGPESGTYPGVVSYYQQRRVYASSANAPDTYAMSQPGRFTNFDRRIPTIDTDAVTGTPWSLQVNGIQWFLSMPGGLLTFTGNQMWQLTGAGGSGLTPVAITPTDQQAQPQAFNGISATIGPMQIGQTVLFADAVGSYVYEISYKYWENIYTGDDITVFSSHLFDGFNLVEWAWARQPYKLVWGVRDDGALLSLTFDKEQEVIGWARHDTQGLFRSVCTVIEPPVNAPYFAVQRFLGAEFGSSAAASVAGTLSAVDLGFLPGDTSSQALGISSSGNVIVGFSSGATVRAVYWDSTNTIHVLPSLGAGSSQAAACSADGSVIVGSSDPGTGFSHAVRWTGGPAWVATDLGLLAGGSFSSALGCSSNGTIIVGGADTALEPQVPCVWINGVVSLLPTTPGRTAGFATACNPTASVIVGETYDSVTADGIATVWTGGPGVWAAATRARIPGAPIALDSAYGTSSDGSVIVGQVGNTLSSISAVYWTPGLTQLPGPLGGPGSLAWACDETGDRIVGAGPSGTQAALWVSGVGQSLPLFAGALSVDSAQAISADGLTMAGFGTNGSAQQTAVRWSFTSTPPTIANIAYTIERMDNRLWPAAENCWCVDSALSLPHFHPNATLSVGSATGLGAIIGTTSLTNGQNYSSLTTATVVDDDGEGPGTGAFPTLTIVGGAIANVTFAPGNQGTGYVRPALVITDPSGQGSGASAVLALNNTTQLITSAAVFATGDIGKVIRSGGGIMTIAAFINAQSVIASITSPILRVIPNSGGVPIPQLSGNWSMDAPVTTISGLGHLADTTVTGLADGAVITPRTVSAAGTITLDTPATEVVIGLGYQAQLQSPYLAEVAVQGQRKRIAEVTARVEASRGIRIGSNQPDASTLSPAPLIAEWRELTDAPDLGVPPYGSTTPPLYTGDVRIPIHGGFAKPGQAAVQQDFPLPMNIIALLTEDDLGDPPQGGKPAARPPDQRPRNFAFTPPGARQ